ncbi:hypothetical protein [Bacillus sp. CGMCC 1.16541]|uniref:hypothetical protein n=1 Tax=Bacillus sp. CGMCC 1.16541 TaxID=2185143 RepID=UPI00194F6AB4|nr:hypothetical protein [Bacillus sp. CGMCC 1.16541]
MECMDLFKRKKKQKSHESSFWGDLLSELVFEILLIPFRILWYALRILVRSVGRLFDGV